MLTTSSVRNGERYSRSPFFSCRAVSVPSREPIHAADPASPSTSGGIDRSAKKPASAARPVTRYRRQTRTVRVTSDTTVRTGPQTGEGAEAPPGRPHPAAGHAVDRHPATVASTAGSCPWARPRLGTASREVRDGCQEHARRALPWAGACHPPGDQPGPRAVRPADLLAVGRRRRPARGRRASRRGCPGGAAGRAGRAGRQRQGPGVGRAGRAPPPRAAHARPARRPARRGRVPPGVPPADARRASSTGSAAARGRPTPAPAPTSPGRRRCCCGARSTPATSARCR